MSGKKDTVTFTQEDRTLEVDGFKFFVGLGALLSLIFSGIGLVSFLPAINDITIALIVMAAVAFTTVIAWIVSSIKGTVLNKFCLLPNSEKNLRIDTGLMLVAFVTFLLGFGGLFAAPFVSPFFVSPFFKEPFVIMAGLLLLPIVTTTIGAIIVKLFVTVYPADRRLPIADIGAVPVPGVTPTPTPAPTQSASPALEGELTAAAPVGAPAATPPGSTSTNPTAFLPAPGVAQLPAASRTQENDRLEGGADVRAVN